MVAMRFLMMQHLRVVNEEYSKQLLPLLVLIVYGSHQI
jgi:hypothetical protein